MLAPAIVAATLFAEALAAPRPITSQAVFQAGKESDIVDLILAAENDGLEKDGQKWNWTVVNELDPLKHLSAISPFYIPTASPDGLPPGCSLERVSLLIRHTSIQGNDDEYEQTMQPFIEKVYKLRDERPELIPADGEWSWLKDWKCPITEDTLEVASKQGKKDAEFLGEYVRDQYKELFPPKGRTGKTVKGKGKGKKQPPYKVWTASSDRDIESAKAYIKGGFPSHQSGPDGHGDGEVVQLVKVPNKARDWDRSLTPHKACDNFEKLSSLEPANKWLAVYAPRVRERLSQNIPELVKEFNDQDILAMQMLCGYETISQGHSAFCHLFTDDEWRDVEYYFDVRFHYMMGYANKLSPYLGMPWVKTADHLLSGADSHGSDPEHSGEPGKLGHAEHSYGGRGVEVEGKLPKPKLPPNATHTQLLHPSFTHRESPAFVAVFLNLYNHSSLALPASADLPLDHRVDDRAWRTSHLVSFLGHVALERFKCPNDRWHTPGMPGGGFDNDFSSAVEAAHSQARDEDEPSEDKGMEGEKAKKKYVSYVRAVVNGKMERMAECEDGIGHACKWDTFREFVQTRSERWGDWESVCDKTDE